MPIVLNMLEARSLGLNSHIDIFGYKTDKLSRMFALVFQSNINNAIVIRLILSAVQKRHVVTRIE